MKDRTKSFLKTMPLKGETYEMVIETVVNNDVGVRKNDKSESTAYKFDNVTTKNKDNYSV